MSIIDRWTANTLDTNALDSQCTRQPVHSTGAGLWPLRNIISSRIDLCLSLIGRQQIHSTRMHILNVDRSIRPSIEEQVHVCLEIVCSLLRNDAISVRIQSRSGANRARGARHWTTHVIDLDLPSLAAGPASSRAWRREKVDEALCHGRVGVGVVATELGAPEPTRRT